MTARLELQDVGKRYGRTGPWAVRHVDLAVAEGEFVALVGPSGCGKSTTLSLIAGLEAPSEGRLLLDGQDVTALGPRERDVAMVFQSYALYPHLTVARNLAFPLEVAKVPREEVRQRVAEAARMLGLEALMERRPGALSGGQRQRVALGRALVRRPRLFLFDEPLSNLDAALRAQLRAELKALHRELRGTFVYVTHDQAEAMTLADRVVVMRAGEVLQVAPPRELYDRPASLFVAGFFGAPAINLAPPEALGLPPREGLTAGVRPEHLELGPGAPPPGAVPGRVFLVEPLGAESWVTVETERRVRLVARARGDFHLPPGAPVWLRPEPGRVHLFDTASGARRDVP